MLVGVLMLMSCGKGASGAEDEEIAMQSEERDSMVSAVAQRHPFEALRLVDSLQTAEAESEVRLAYYRAEVYDKMGEKQKAEKWGKKALKGDALMEESPVVFYKACDLVATMLDYREKYEEALLVTQRGLEVASSDQTPQGRHWLAVLLHDMGYSQMKLGRIDEAEKYFSQSYIALKQIATANNTFDNVHMLARVAYNIVDAYNSTGQYDKAESWMESANEAAEILAQSLQCTEDMKEDYEGGLAIQQAIILLKKGHKQEADRLYSKASAMGYANTDIGIAERAVYLEMAGRTEELAQLMPRVDELSEAWGTDLLPDDGD